MAHYQFGQNPDGFLKVNFGKPPRADEGDFALPVHNQEIRLVFPQPESFA
jgi:hypothetical protein